jgi:hypothetical protein
MMSYKFKKTFFIQWIFLIPKLKVKLLKEIRNHFIKNKIK